MFISVQYEGFFNSTQSFHYTVRDSVIGQEVIRLKIRSRQIAVFEFYRKNKCNIARNLAAYLAYDGFYSDSIIIDVCLYDISDHFSKEMVENLEPCIRHEMQRIELHNRLGL